MDGWRRKAPCQLRFQSIQRSRSHRLLQWTFPIPACVRHPANTIHWPNTGSMYRVWCGPVIHAGTMPLNSQAPDANSCRHQILQQRWWNEGRAKPALGRRWPDISCSPRSSYDHIYYSHSPLNKKHFCSYCTMLAQRRSPVWADVVQMLYRCFVFAGPVHLYVWVAAPGCESQHITLLLDHHPCPARQVCQAKKNYFTQESRVLGAKHCLLSVSLTTFLIIIKDFL